MSMPRKRPSLENEWQLPHVGMDGRTILEAVFFRSRRRQQMSGTAFSANGWMTPWVLRLGISGTSR